MLYSVQGHRGLCAQQQGRLPVGGGMSFQSGGNFPLFSPSVSPLAKKGTSEAGEGVG